MDGAFLQDKISRGMGAAARQLGTQYCVFRPQGVCDPLSSRNLIIRLYAIFTPACGAAALADQACSTAWFGEFDTSYTKEGDILVGQQGNFFIGAQPALSPAVCIKAARSISVSRPAPPINGGYSGFSSESSQVLCESVPAAIQSQASHISGNLPETRFGMWLIQIPALPVTLYASDIVSDDLGRVFVCASAEIGEAGWRLLCREVAG